MSEFRKKKLTFGLADVKTFCAEVLPLLCQYFLVNDENLTSKWRHEFTSSLGEEVVDLTRNVVKTMNMDEAFQPIRYDLHHTFKLKYFNLISLYNDRVL